MKNSLNLKNDEQSKIFLQRLANKPKKDFFPGVVIFANNGTSTNTQCVVYEDGVLLNNDNPTRKLWSTRGGDWDTKNEYVVRHEFVG